MGDLGLVALSCQEMKRIVIFGNSVSQRIRPRLEGAKTYGQLLNEEDTLEVEDRSRAASMVTDMDSSELSSDIARADIVIINYGIVAASTRSLPRWLYTYMSRDLSAVSLIGKWSRLVLRKCESMCRPHLVKLRGYKSWCTESDFAEGLKSIIRMTDDATDVILIGINKPGERIERQLPMTTASARSFDEAVELIARETSSSYLRTWHEIPVERMPDGIHFDALGHELIARQLIQLIEE